MKLSVIVPVYNAEKYLIVLLESLVNQSYKEKEIILVDDGSTDNSGRICDDYSEKYSFVRTVHTENRGVQSARNTGLDLVLQEGRNSGLFFGGGGGILHLQIAMMR